MSFSTMSRNVFLYYISIVLLVQQRKLVHSFSAVLPTRQQPTKNCCVNQFPQPNRRSRLYPSELYESVSSVGTTATSSKDIEIDEQRRAELLQREGPYWKLDRTNGGTVEFGATADLVTQLNDVGGPDSWQDIAEWLTDSRELAMSIWDPELVTSLGNNIYRLQIMKLRFVTISIQPTVDVLMTTQYYNNDITKPIFIVQSTNFEPNIQLLPGMPKYDSKALGIVIEVAGRLVPSKNGKSVTGSIAFTTSGKLPLALSILPERVLKAASDTINETVANFAIRSFQTGAKAKYNDFQMKKEKK